MQHLVLINEILSFTKELTDICDQFTEKFINNEENVCQQLFDILACGVNTIKQCYPNVEEYLNHAFYIEMVENIEYTLEKLTVLINKEENEKALNLVKFQLHPFFLEFWEELYYWSIIYPDKEKMETYYKNEFVSHHANTLICRDKPKYKISIMIPVYNKLDYTKQCIDSIYRNTDFVKHNCELILINDGSNDGTQEYFESLGAAKIVHFKKNVKAMIFTVGYRICEGEFLLFVNNDTIVTNGWLENLLACIESDPSIITVSPCTPNTSNLQNNYYNEKISELDILDIMNQSNPKLWEDRARILPVIALYRVSLIDKIGFADRLFYTMEFWDDDFSLRARRSGYRQILCRDTCCFHFGSVTGKDDRLKNNTLITGRKLFVEKNGFDAWKKTDMGFNEEHCISLMPPQKQISILGIECGNGDFLLKLKSLLRSMGKNVELHTIVTNENDRLDLLPISETCILTRDISSYDFKGAGRLYDFIFIAPPLERYVNFVQFLSILQSCMNDNTNIVFSVTNIFYHSVLKHLLKLHFPEDEDFVTFLNISKLQQQINENFSEFDAIAQVGMKEDIQAFVEEHCAGTEHNTHLKILMSSKYLWYYCRK